MLIKITYSARNFARTPLSCSNSARYLKTFPALRTWNLGRGPKNFSFVLAMSLIYCSLILEISLNHKVFSICFVFSFNFSFNCYAYHSVLTIFTILLKFCSKMPYSAGRILVSKIAYSARNSAGRIYPSLNNGLAFSSEVFSDNKRGERGIFRSKLLSDENICSLKHGINSLNTNQFLEITQKSAYLALQLQQPQQSAFYSAARLTFVITRLKTYQNFTPYGRLFFF